MKNIFHILTFFSIAIFLLSSCIVNVSDKIRGKQKWNIRVIPVCWENPSSTDQRERDLVKAAIDSTWEKYGDIDFDRWCDCKELPYNQGIRIKIIDNIPYTQKLGKKLEGQLAGMGLTFTWRPTNISASLANDHDLLIQVMAIHEFGHALGFAHEQNNMDCNFPNCTEGPQGPNGDWFFARCDSLSVMNYCNPSYLGSGKLSKDDIAAVQTIYSPKRYNDKRDTISLKLVSNYRKLNDATFFRRIYNKIRYRGNSHELRVFVQGYSDQIDNISYVMYHLPEDADFGDTTMLVRDDNSNYGVILRVYGVFQMWAEIFYNNGSSIKTDEIKIDWPTPPGADLPIDKSGGSARGRSSRRTNEAASPDPKE